MAAKKKSLPTPPPAPTVEAPPPPRPQPPPPPVLDLDSASDRVSGDQMEAMLRVAKPVNKPDISRLPDATEGGRPLFTAGDKIVVERYATVLAGAPYLDTKTYKVLGVNEANGAVRLFDEELNQFASTNYVEGLRSGYVFKFAMGNKVATKKKRGRPRKNPIEAVQPDKPAGEKRGRGRPKGSKNRPKEVVAAERAEKKAKIVEKKKKRGAKKAP